MLSLEGIFIDYLGPIVNPKIDIRLRGPDNDYLQNSIGDVLSGFIATVLIILLLDLLQKITLLLLVLHNYNIWSSFK